MTASASHISPYVSLFSFVIGLPTLAATYYQAWKARQESREVRDGLVYSSYCLEFVTEEGFSVNLIPLETLHTLPKQGEIVLLPGGSTAHPSPAHAAFRVLHVEHLYARVVGGKALAGQARLVKSVAHVVLLS